MQAGGLADIKTKLVHMYKTEELKLVPQYK